MGVRRIPDQMIIKQAIRLLEQLSGLPATVQAKILREAARMAAQGGAELQDGCKGGNS